MLNDNNSRGWGWWIGWLATIVFVVGGAVNGLMLHGRPQLLGQILNVTYAGLIAAFLWLGKDALRPRE